MAGIRVLVRDSGGVLALDFPTATGWRIGLTPSNYDTLVIQKGSEVNGKTTDDIVASFMEWIGVSHLDSIDVSEQEK